MSRCASPADRVRGQQGHGRRGWNARSRRQTSCQGAIITRRGGSRSWQEADEGNPHGDKRPIRRPKDYRNEADRASHIPYCTQPLSQKQGRNIGGEGGCMVRKVVIRMGSPGMGQINISSHRLDKSEIQNPITRTSSDTIYPRNYRTVLISVTAVLMILTSTSTSTRTPYCLDYRTTRTSRLQYSYWYSYKIWKSRNE